MNRRNNHLFIIFVLSVASLGLVIESYVMGWEFWVPPLIIIGIIACWTIHIANKGSEYFRETFYFIFACLVAFYHGVHRTSFFDVSIIAMLLFATMANMNRKAFMHIYLLEYLIIMMIQLVITSKQTDIVIDPLNISRLILHIFAVLLVYFNCVRHIQERIDALECDKEKDAKIEAYDEDMEDFLSNISHELRTPVNVVNGMSDLMIRRNAGEEAVAIKKAGIRLSHHIEDIQDYTETKRHKLTLEEEDYLSTSLIDDMVTNFRNNDENKNLELVVDLNPKVPLKMRGDIKKLHKILRHLTENAIKFTREGGICVSMSTEETSYGVNLCIDVTDTGAGMERKAIALVADTMYQGDKKRDRSSGGIGLGLSIVYGLAHRMGGFVRITSEIGTGTNVRVTIPQTVVDKSPCLKTDGRQHGNILFHVHLGKYRVAEVREFYHNMAARLASGIDVTLYQADTILDVRRMVDDGNVSHIFMGEEEYAENADYFDELSQEDIVVVVSAGTDFYPNYGSHVISMPKPLYGYPVIRILNEGNKAGELVSEYKNRHPLFAGIRTLVVDDESMNLVVATGLFQNYGMIVDTASRGMEAVEKFREYDYDVIFMDHMMPEMDGVEAMHRIKRVSVEQDKPVRVIALTANVVSGAREMFVKEGFDGFIAKPINLADFERVMMRVLPDRKNTPEV